MKKIRDYEPTSIHDWCAQQKTTYLLDDDEKKEFKEMLEDGKYAEWENLIRRELGLTDRRPAYDGARYDIYYFYLTRNDNLTVVEEWGYNV